MSAAWVKRFSDARNRRQVCNIHRSTLQMPKKPLSKVFPIKSESSSDDPSLPLFTTYGPKRSESFGKSHVFIPVCPGTNCEYDSAAAFERAGATAEIMVLRNETPQDLAESIDEMAKRIAKAQIIMFPGGFSAGDEPEGSGKFIATLFRSPALKEALNDLLYKRDGLALGCLQRFPGADQTGAPALWPDPASASGQPDADVQYDWPPSVADG